MSTNQFRVLQLASGDLWAGAEVQLFQLCKQLLKQIGTDNLMVILFNEGQLAKKLRAQTINVVVIDEANHSFFSLIKNVVNICKEFNPAVVHTHREKENIIGSLAAWSCGASSVRTVHGNQEHSFSFKKPHRAMVGLIDYLCAKFLQKKLVAVSSELLHNLSKHFPSDKLLKISNGIEPVDKSQLASHSKAKHNQVTIGIVGRLEPVKRVDRFINVASRIKQANPNTNCYYKIIGDGGCYSDLKQQVFDLKLEQQVEFTGHVDNVLPELANLDILVIASDSEGLPMILLEAMSLEVLVAATPVGAIPSVLEHGVCGILAEEKTADGLTVALQKALDSDQDRPCYLSNAKQRVYEHFSAHRMTIEYMALYTQLSQTNDLASSPSPN